MLKKATVAGPCSARSVAEPPQLRQTSTLSAQFDMSSTCATGAPCVAIEPGSRRMKTTTSSMSSFLEIACSAPRPRLPYPLIATLIMSSPAVVALPLSLPSGPDGREARRARRDEG